MKKYALLTSIVALIWGTSFIAVKIGLESTSPIMLAFLRFLISSPLMAIILIMRKKIVKISKKDIPYLIILSLTGVTLLYIIQFTGIDYTTAINSALLINTNVIFIAIFSVIFLKERMTAKKIAGILAGFTGAAIVITDGSFPVSIHAKGDFLILISAISWAIYTIVGKKLLGRYDSFTITTYTFLLGTFLFLPFIYRESSIPTSLKAWGNITNKKKMLT